MALPIQTGVKMPESSLGQFIRAFNHGYHNHHAQHNNLSRQDIMDMARTVGYTTPNDKQILQRFNSVSLISRHECTKPWISAVLQNRVPTSNWTQSGSVDFSEIQCINQLKNDTQCELTLQWMPASTRNGHPIKQILKLQKRNNQWLIDQISQDRHTRRSSDAIYAPIWPSICPYLVIPVDHDVELVIHLQSFRVKTEKSTTSSHSPHAQMIQPICGLIGVVPNSQWQILTNVLVLGDGISIPSRSGQCRIFVNVGPSRNVQDLQFSICSENQTYPRQLRLLFVSFMTVIDFATD